MPRTQGRRAARQVASVTLRPYAYCAGESGDLMEESTCQWHEDGDFRDTLTSAKDHARMTGHKVVVESVTRSLYSSPDA